MPYSSSCPQTEETSEPTSPSSASYAQQIQDDLVKHDDPVSRLRRTWMLWLGASIALIVVFGLTILGSEIPKRKQFATMTATASAIADATFASGTREASAVLARKTATAATAAADLTARAAMAAATVTADSAIKAAIVAATATARVQPTTTPTLVPRATATGTSVQDTELDALRLIPTQDPVIPLWARLQSIQGKVVSADRSEDRVSMLPLPMSTGDVAGLVWSPDGNILAVADAQGLFLYTLNTMTEIRLAEDPTFSVSFSPDGKFLASGGDTVRLWNVETREISRTLGGLTGRIESVAFSPDGKTVAAGKDGTGLTACLWRVSDGTPLRNLMGRSVAFSAVGTLATASGPFSASQFVWVYDVANGGLQDTLMGMTVPLTSIAFSLKGDAIVLGEARVDHSIGGIDVYVREGNGSRFSQSSSGNIGGTPVWAAAFSPGGTTLVLGESQGQVGVARFSPKGAIPVAHDYTLIAHSPSTAVTAVAFAPNGVIVASGACDGTIRLWALRRPFQWYYH